VVIKYYASYCRACKALEPKFQAVKDDRQLINLPIVWAEYESQRKNRELFQKLNVVALPTVQFYDGSRGLIENFPCGPAKIPLLKQKLAQFLNSRVDPKTLQLKEVVEKPKLTQAEEAQQIEPRVERQVSESEFITPEHIAHLRDGLPFFRDLTTTEFDELLSKAKLLTYNPGDLIIRQGMPPTTFFVLKSGKVEMSIRGRFDDPISTPPDYLGVVINELKKYDYFGERALTTGEPYACSIRVLEKTRAFAFHVDDIPESSILSKKRRANAAFVEKLSKRYVLPQDYRPSYPPTQREQCVLELLVRFKQIRQAAKCFEYAMKSQPNWGDEGEIARRSLLVSKLSKAQANEFQDVFSIVDKDNKGHISLSEMQKFMQSARANKSTDELMVMLSRVNPNFDENKDYAISRDEFMGVMAEAEFYNLFTETFEELDEDRTGYVRAGDLDEVLGGVRNLISSDETNIIDVEDKDMLVDYEQFSRMLLGAAL
jgi:calmodulin